MYQHQSLAKDDGTRKVWGKDRNKGEQFSKHQMGIMEVPNWISRNSLEKTCITQGNGKERSNTLASIDSCDTNPEVDDGSSSDEEIVEFNEEPCRAALKLGNSEAKLEPGRREFNFQQGTHLLRREDLKKEEAERLLWKVHDKHLIRRLDPEHLDNQIVYRKTDNYVGWKSQDRHLYTPIRVTTMGRKGRNRVVQPNWDIVETLANENVNATEDPKNALAPPSRIN
jgi:hypothetical protein